jgi:hypothetical protein
MKTPATQRESRQTTPPAGPGELVLKIHGGTWHGRIVRLAALRCTLGSGPQCSLRLRLPGLAPLVCEIDRTAEPALIRCWAPGVLLNGQPCQQALLNIGDRLNLAGMDFEILGGIAAALPWAGGLPDQLAKPAKKKSAKPAATKPVAPSPALELTRPAKQDRPTKKSPQRRSDKPEKKPARDTQAFRSQLPEQFTLPQLPKVPGKQKKSKSPEALREKYLRLREKLRTQQTELEQRTAELAAGQAKLAERQEKLTTRKTTLEARKAELKTTADKLASETNSLKAQREELLAQQAELRTQHDDLQTDHSALQAERQVLAKQQGEFAVEQTALQTQRELQTTQQADLLKQQEQLRVQSECLRAEQETLQTEQSQLSKQRETLQQQETALQAHQLNYEAREEVLQAQEEQLSLQHDQFRAQQILLRAEQEKLEARQTELDQRRCELERENQKLSQREVQYNQERERLDNELTELQKEQRELATGRQQLLRGHEKFREAQAQHEEALKSLQLERQSLEAARLEVQQARAELSLSHQRLQSETQQHEMELLRAKHDLDLRLSEHAAACELLTQERSGLVLAQQKLDTAKQELAALNAAWQLDRAAWDAKCVAVGAEQNRLSLQIAATEANLLEHEADLITRETDVTAREAEVATRQAELTRELAEVEEERRVLAAATARLTCDQLDLEEARTDFRMHAEELELKIAKQDEDRANFDSQRTVLERLLLDQRDCLTTDRANFVKLRDSYLEERSRWQKTKSRTEHDWVQKYHSFEQRESQLQIEGERLRIMLGTLNHQEQQLAAAKEDLQQRRHETSLAVRNLEEQQSAWTQQQKDWERREAEFIAEQKRLESCRSAFQVEREKWERQQAAWQDERQKLGREKAEIERERKSVHQERAEWDRIRASQLAQASLMAELPSPEEIQQRETSLNQQAAELTAWRDQLRSQQQDYDTQRAEWQTQFNTAQADLDRINGERAEFQRQLSTQQSERERLEQLQGELDELRRHLHSQRQDNEARAQDVVARESNLLPRELEIRQAGEQLAQREAQLAMERAGYEMQRVKQQELSKNLASQRADLDRRMMSPGEQFEACERLQQELDQERQTLNQLRGELESLRKNPEAASPGNAQRVTELEAELAQVREELMVQLAANEQEREQLAHDRSELEQARADREQQPTNDEPASATADHADVCEDVATELEQTVSDELAAETETSTNDATDEELEATLATNADDTSGAELSDESAEQPATNDHEDQIFARLRALTSGKAVPEEKSARDQRGSLRASFFKGEDETETAEDETEADDDAETRESEPVNQAPAVKSYLPTNVDDEEDEPDDEPAPAAAAARPAPAPKAHDGEDESIDDYMQRLLNRMRGSADGEGKISNQNQNGKDQHAKEKQKRAEQALREAADATPAKPKREYVRTEAPEKKADLAAMRELANSTARTAVQTSRSKIAASQALNKLIVGGGGMALCAGALMFLGEEESLFQLVAGGGMILSLLWLAYGLYLSRGMLFAKAKRELVLTPQATSETNDSAASNSEPEALAETSTVEAS